MSNKKQVDTKNKKGNSPLVKGIALCAVIGVSVTGGFFIGKNVGSNLPATIKYYSASKPVAMVNGQEIPGKDFKASMKILFQVNKNRKLSDEEIKTFEDQYLDYTTMNKAIYDVAVKEKFKADEESVSLNYSSVMKELEQMLGMKEDEVLKKFNLTKDNIMETLRQEYITNLYLDKKSVVTEDEALKYYNANPDKFYQYKASHILISTVDENGNPLSAEEKAKAKAKAEALLEEIKKGANFEELAKENSQDGSAQNGGDLGYFKKGEMVPEFEKAVAETKVGDLYPKLVETSYGYHIVKRTGENTEKFEDAKLSIMDELSYNKKTQIIEKVRKESDIKILYKN